MNSRIRLATIVVAFAVAASACGAGAIDLAETPQALDQTVTETVQLADPTPDSANAVEPTGQPATESPSSPVVVDEPAEASSQPGTREPVSEQVALPAEPQTGPAGGALDPTIPWLSASEDGVFVAGLTSQAIEDRIGLDPGVIVVEDNPRAPGPTLSFGPGEVGRGALIVQLNTSTLTFDDIVASQPGATIENVAGYDLLVVGGLAAFIDFPEGPVQVQSYSFSHETSGLELARLIAEGRAAIS